MGFVFFFFSTDWHHFACYLIFECRHVPRDEPIDLLNVAFENPRKIKVQQKGNINPNKKKSKAKVSESDTDPTLSNSTVAEFMVPDRVTGLSEVEELRKLCPGRVWNFVSLFLCYPCIAFDIGDLISQGRN